MTYEAVDIYVREDGLVGAPVVGMLVRVYDKTNSVIYGEGVTDDTGKAGFLLWAQSYNLRFYKFGARVQQPQAIEVLSPPPGTTLVNAFDVKAVVSSRPVATDPRLCRASGFFRDVAGAVDPNVAMVFAPAFSPILLEAAAVLGERRDIRTDRTGFAAIDLIRGARYVATVQGSEVLTRCVEVPDAPSVNLPDLLFPVVERVEFLENLVQPPLPLGTTWLLTPKVFGSNGVPLTGTATADVVWSSSDELVMSVGVEAEILTITARGVGTALLQASRRDNSIVRIPNTPISGVPLSITVV